MSLNRRRKNPGAGKKVDFNRIGEERDVPGWFALQSKTDVKKMIRVYGYPLSYTEKAGWRAYDEVMLLKAPCNHCGQVGHGTKLHLCPGHYAIPVSLPGDDPAWPDKTIPGFLEKLNRFIKCGYTGMTNDDGGHVCQGKPSLSWHGVQFFSAHEWRTK